MITKPTSKNNECDFTKLFNNKFLRKNEMKKLSISTFHENTKYIVNVQLLLKIIVNSEK